MSERRYNEAEVAAIFGRATEEQQTVHERLPSGDGLTLAEVQQIGREVGLAPELIVRAAKAIDQGGRPTSRTLLGLPIGVGRTVDLERRLSDQEWDRLVVDLRDTFDARGSVKQDGSFRQWTNGNLQILLEPTDTGQQLRMRTLNGNAQGMMAGGFGITLVAFLGILVRTLGTGPVDVGRVSALAVLAAVGVGAFAFAALRLPRWARLRQEQMEKIAERLTLAPAPTEPPNDQ